MKATSNVGDSYDADALTRRYFYLYRPHHIAEAGEREALDTLLLDPSWLKAKLAATGSPLALVADYDQHAASAAQKLIGRTLRLTAGICVRDQRQLIPQLVGRLMAKEAIIATGFLDAARRALLSPAILEKHSSLTSPGAEAVRIEGHSDRVTALCVLPDGRLASGSWDSTIGLWDVTSGAETARLEVHFSSISALCMLPDGRLASGSFGNTIRLWRVTSGVETECPEGPVGWLKGLARWFKGLTGSFTSTRSLGIVTALNVLPDGRLAWGSDKTIRLWDATSRTETARLEGHSQSVTALCVLPDGRLASGSWDKMIRLWDVDSCDEVARLEGHSRSATELSGLVDALCLLPMVA